MQTHNSKPTAPTSSRTSRIAITPYTSLPQGLASLTRPTHRTPTMSPESMVEALTATGAFRVLRRLDERTRYEHEQGVRTHVALYVDVETTGTSHANDAIIQLAVIPFTFTADGRVCDVRRAEVWFEDPGVPISVEITTLTGIRDADVAGKRIDDSRVQQLLAEADLVIAHNAGFDRPFLERRLPAFAAVRWGCSMSEVPWQDEGLPTLKLEWLSERHTRVFYDAHRADADCRAGIHLLASTLPSGKRAMAALLERVREKSVRVWAVQSPFATKDALKQRGYRWNAGEDGMPRAWYRDVREAELLAETAWLQEHVYKKGVPCPAVVQRFGAKARYSHRIAGLAMQPVVPWQGEREAAKLAAT